MMGKAYLAYFSDYVLAVGAGAVGGYPVPVAGAQVTCYPVGAFAAGTLPGGGTVAAPPLATAITDGTGRFTFPALPSDDYHLLIAYTPPGGSAVAIWRYHVPVAAVAVGRMALAATRGACLGGTLGRLGAGLGATILCLGDDTTVGYNATGTVAGGANDGYDPWLAAATAAELAGHFAPAGTIQAVGAMVGAGKGYETVWVPYSSGQVGVQGSGWAAHGGYQGAALNSSGGSFEIVTNHAGDSVTIGGRFVDLAMLCRRWSDCGQVGVSVDGGPSQLVDLYRGYPSSTTDLADANGASAPQDRVMLAHGLQDSAHTVVVTLLAGRNAASSGTYWRLEGLELGRWRRYGYEVDATEPQGWLLRGTVAVPIVVAASGSLAVSFPVATTGQGSAPVVVATSQAAAYYCAASGIGAAGFTLTAVRRDGSVVTDTPVCNWLAFG